jgi:hypothetical protein
MMMLNPRLVNCVDCSSITSLLDDIDCKLTQLAKLQYANITLALNRIIPTAAIDDLLNYKRILLYKFCNPDYAKQFSVEQIASKVKILINK